MNSSEIDYADTRLHPIWTESEAQSFLPVKPWSICLSDTHPKGEFQTSVLRVGRRIQIDGLLPYSLFKKTDTPVEDPEAHELFIHAMVFRVPSGQYVVCPLSYQEPEDRFRFVTNTEEKLVKDLLHEDAKVTLHITQHTRDIERKPLQFDLHGESDLVFTLACPLTGTDLAGEVIVDANNTTVIAANRGNTLELVGHGPWYRAFELVGVVYGVEAGAPKLEEDGPDYLPPVDQNEPEDN